ncbi:hypothetical protein TNCV_306051 [Trichonephila clavipes]|nr:hypothetical protein TNCV_306051 [Trichonephila clavipes]
MSLVRIGEELKLQIGCKSKASSYTGHLGDGPRHLEPSTSDENGTTTSPNYHITPHQREDVSALDRLNVHRPLPYTMGL